MTAPAFCTRCGQAVEFFVPDGDAFKRAVCTSCNHIHYVNPKIVVGCIATWGDKVVWMRRATPPKEGMWVIPTGFLELGETPEQGAMRELSEETGAVVDPQSLRLYLVGSLPELGELHLLYRAQMVCPDIRTTQEASAVGLFSKEMAPWKDCAYPDVLDLMRQFYIDHERSSYGVYSATYSSDGLSLFATAQSQDEKKATLQGDLL